MKNSKWLSVTKFTTEYLYTKDGWEIKLANFKTCKNELDKLEIPLDFINAYIEDDNQNVISLYMHGEVSRDHKSYKNALYDLLFKLTDNFYKKFGIKLWIDKAALTDIR